MSGAPRPLCSEADRERLVALLREHYAVGLLGANAIVAMRFDSSEISQQLTEIAAYGTAVVVRPAG